MSLSSSSLLALLYLLLVWLILKGGKLSTREMRFLYRDPAHPGALHSGLKQWSTHHVAVLIVKPVKVAEPAHTGTITLGITE